LSASQDRRAIGLDEKLIPRRSEIGSVVGHRQNPMAVLRESSLLAISFHKEKFFADVVGGMQVSKLSDCVPGSIPLRREVLDKPAEMLEINLNLFPVDLRIVKDGKPYFFQCRKQTFSSDGGRRRRSTEQAAGLLG
jgi:hypothetical protein